MANAVAARAAAALSTFGQPGALRLLGMVQDLTQAAHVCARGRALHVAADLGQTRLNFRLDAGGWSVDGAGWGVGGTPVASPLAFVRSRMRADLHAVVTRVRPTWLVRGGIVVRDTCGRFFAACVAFVEAAVRGNGTAWTTPLRAVEVSVTTDEGDASFECAFDGTAWTIRELFNLHPELRLERSISDPAAVMSALVRDRLATVTVHAPYKHPHLAAYADFRFDLPHARRARAMDRLKWPLRKHMAKRLERPGGPRMRAAMNATFAEIATRNSR